MYITKNDFSRPGYTLTKHGKANLQSAALTNRASIILVQYVFFSFKIKQKDLMVQKSNKPKGALVQFAAVSLLTSDTVHFFLTVAKISYQMLVMLTRVLRPTIFIFCIFRYVMFVMLCIQRRNLLILIAKNASANEFQQLSN